VLHFGKLLALLTNSLGLTGLQETHIPTYIEKWLVTSGNTKGGIITIPLTSCLTSLDYYVLQIKTKIVSCHTADTKPVQQEVNGTSPFSFPWLRM
jgi:hypothetical protein